MIAYRFSSAENDSRQSTQISRSGLLKERRPASKAERNRQDSDLGPTRSRPGLYTTSALHPYQ